MHCQNSRVDITAQVSFASKTHAVFPKLAQARSSEEESLLGILSPSSG